jgi:beta-mannanase
MKRFFQTLAVIVLLVSIAPMDQNPVIASTGDLGITVGAHIRPTPNYGDEVTAFNKITGKNIGVVMYFLDWSSMSNDHLAYDKYLVDNLNTHMASGTEPVVMLTWQPVNGRKVTGCDRDYGSTEVMVVPIINGLCDAYLRNFADGLALRPERFLLRFAHEMNISNTYTWWAGNYGNDTSKYISMFRHVHVVVNAELARKGKTNVEWVWSPNYASNPPDSWNAIHNYYPGDSYVDWIGLSGYNWNSNQSFSDLYDSVLRNLACSYAKPQIISEIGTVDGSPTKSAWITDAYQRAPNYPFLRSIVWFNDYAYADANSSDFRITTSTAASGSVSAVPSTSNPSWTNAYKQAVASSNYNSTLPSLASATPLKTYCGPDLPNKLYIPFARN